MSRTLPILCSASVVRNILANLQTEDRRPVKRQPPPGERVEIVAYLQRRAADVWSGPAESAMRHEADAIERGEHLRAKR